MNYAFSDTTDLSDLFLHVSGSIIIAGLETGMTADMMVQWVWVPAPAPGSLSSVAQTYGVGRENQLPASCSFSAPSENVKTIKQCEYKPNLVSVSELSFSCYETLLVYPMDQ